MSFRGHVIGFKPYDWSIESYSFLQGGLRLLRFVRDSVLFRYSFAMLGYPTELLVPIC